MDQIAAAVRARVPQATRTIRDFEEKPSRPGTTADPVASRTLRSAEELEFLKSNEEGTDAASIAYTCIGLCNDLNQNEDQACAYFLSALVTTIPSLEAVSISTLQEMGYGVSVLTGEAITQAEIALHPPPRQTRKVLVMISQLIFLLYKNVSELSYARFMTNRTTAIKALVGVSGPLFPGGGTEEIVVTFNRAKIFRQTLGAQYPLKKAVLNAMLHIQHSETPNARMYAYICGILCWTEMSSLMFVYQTLCLTRSPVLKDIRVRDELKNLYSAFSDIVKEDHPQYYRILKAHQDTRKIEKSKFPTLAAVAQELRREHQGTVSQFAGSRATDTATVNELVALHKAYLTMQPVQTVDRYADFLYGTDADTADTGPVPQDGAGV